MTKKIAIYLAGNIKKEHETQGDFWSDEEINCLRAHLGEFEVSFLNPAFRTDQLTDSLSVFGRDIVQVYCCDVVFVDARNSRGLGVGAEMMWCKMNGTPLVVWAPMNSHYRKSYTTILDKPVKDYVHPFVASLSDKIVDTLEEGAEWIKTLMNGGSEIQIKGKEQMKRAMEYYLETQLLHDKPMQQLVNSHQALSCRIDQLRSVAEV